MRMIVDAWRAPRTRSCPSANRWLFLVLTLSLAGCRSDCDPAICPKVDQDATPTDIKVKLASGELLTLAIDEAENIAVADGGELVASADDWYCWSSPTTVCRMTLKRLRVQLAGFEFVTSAGNTVHLEDIVSAIATPLVLENTGTGYIIPSGTKVISSLTVDGQSDCAEAVTTQLAYLRFDFFLQLLTFEGTLPLTFHLTNNNCQQLSGHVSGLVSGVRPWAQSPEN